MKYESVYVRGREARSCDLQALTDDTLQMVNSETRADIAQSRCATEERGKAPGT